MIKLISPESNKELFKDSKNSCLTTQDGLENFTIIDGAYKFLKIDDSFYEGAYLNRTKFIPNSNNPFNIVPLWMINHGYLFAVRNTFARGSTILDLGCASGVDFFGANFNMIGIDLSLASLKGLKNYQLAVQADATKLPFENSSVDGVISSFFWEHIPPDIKGTMLMEFYRVLKPGGKIVFLYDIETENTLIKKIKNKSKDLYNNLFLNRDGHLGYETLNENAVRFKKFGYTVKKHFGMERTWIVSNSALEKLRNLNGLVGIYSSVLFRITNLRLFSYLYVLFVRLWDETFGRLWDENKSRIVITVAEKKC